MSHQITAAPGSVPRNRARPPTRSGVPAPQPGAAVPVVDRSRPTVARRRSIEPAVWYGRPGGFPTHHPYVRRFWTAAIGPGAVADLMRLAVAAQRGRSLPLPITTEMLLREGLIAWRHGRLLAGVSVPPLPIRYVRRMPPALQREHQRALADLRTGAEA